MVKWLNKAVFQLKKNQTNPFHYSPDFKYIYRFVGMDRSLLYRHRSQFSMVFAQLACNSLVDNKGEYKTTKNIMMVVMMKDHSQQWASCSTDDI